MGLSWSGRRRNNNFLQNPPPSLFISSYASGLSPVPPPPSHLLPPPPYYNVPYPSQPYPPQNSYPVPPPLPHSCCCQYSAGYNACEYNGPVTLGRANCHHFQANQSNGWSGIRPFSAALQLQPPSYVEHQAARKIRNDVNVHKDTIRIEADENNPGYHLVSFTFDALVDGSITIFYFAKEGVNCSFSPLYPEVHVPIRIPFQKGLCQKFHQPSGTGIDLGFFELDDLSKPSPGEDAFPLVIFAEACSAPLPTGVLLGQPQPMSSHAQITQAILEKSNEGPFQVKVINQILWVDGVRYELRDIYGIGNSSEVRVDDNESGKECVICMSEPKDTAVLPCRHMCMCGDCAKALRLQTNKCPICRQPIEELIEIKVNKNDL